VQHWLQVPRLSCWSRLVEGQSWLETLVATWLRQLWLSQPNVDQVNWLKMFPVPCLTTKPWPVACLCDQLHPTNRP
jgi:hypothetical protein